MKHEDQSKYLFQLQAELIDTKVDLSVSKAISQVVDQIISLRGDMHEMKHEIHQEIGGLKTEMNNRFTNVEGRLSSVEVVLGMQKQKRDELRIRFYDYVFKAGWVVFGVAIGYVVTHFSSIFQ